MRAVVFVLSVLLASAPGPGAQRPERQSASDLRLERKVVTVDVTVIDRIGRFVVGLEPSHFEVYDNKVLQKIEFFANADEPVTIGVIFDTSGSMKGHHGDSREALLRFTETRIVEDEYFLVTFDTRARLARDFTHDVESLAKSLTLVEAEGRTALYDAVYLGVLKAQQGKHSRRALLVISDMGENRSRYTDSELRKLVQEADVPIYVLAIRSFPALPFELSRSDEIGPWGSGGRAFFITPDTSLSGACVQMALELRQRYSIGYYPTSRANDGTWHDVRVKLKLPRGSPRFGVIARPGYVDR
jgi:Ca-activated chloride channel homolog